MSGRDGVCILSREDVTQTSEREETDLFIASSADLINSSFDPRLSALKKFSSPSPFTNPTSACLPLSTSAPSNLSFTRAAQQLTSFDERSELKCHRD